MGRAAPSCAAGAEAPRCCGPRRPSFTALGFLAAVGLLLGSGTGAGRGQRGARARRAPGSGSGVRGSGGAGRCGAAAAACLGVPFPPRGQRARRARGGAGPADGEADAALEVVGVKPGSVGLCGGLPEDAGICCFFLLRAEPALAWRVGKWGEGGSYPAHGRCLLKWTVCSTRK